MRQGIMVRVKSRTLFAIIIVAAAVAAGAVFVLLDTSEREPQKQEPHAILGSEFTRYTNDRYGSSFEYPRGMTVETVDEDEGEVIVFHDRFQIFVSPFGDDEAITPERILEDIPGLVIREPHTVVLGTRANASFDALAFWSEDAVIGKTREVWFTHDGNLYEITARADFDTMLAGILSTWQFER